MAGDTFTRNKFDWFEQIALDGELPTIGLRVAVILATRYLSRTHGYAWPSIPTLATTLGVSENTIRRALQSLAARGHIAVTIGGGRNATNSYRPLVQSDASGRQKPSQKLKGLRGPKPSQKLQGFEQETLPNLELNPPKIENKPSQNWDPNPIEEPYDEPIEGERLPQPAKNPKQKPAAKAPPDASQHLAGFEEFWKAYPRRIAKDSARRAYANAIKNGATPADLLAGAERFAAERMREPDLFKREKYTPHPATWLNTGRWTDEAAAEDTRPHEDQGRGRPSMFEIALAGRGSK